MKNILMIGITLIIVGVLLMTGGYMAAGRSLEGFNSKNNHYVERSYECSGNISSIKVEENSNHLTIISGDADKISVSCFDRENKELYDIKEEGGVLVVKRNENKDFNFLNIDFTDHTMVVTVPRDYKGDIDAVVISGGMDLTNVCGNAISVKNTSGSIKLENVTSESDISVENNSGSIKLINVNAGGNLNAKGNSGGISLDSLNSEGNINIKNTSGSIRGTILGKESDYKIHAEVTSGSCNLNNSDSGSRELNVKNTSGSIKLEFISK